MTDRVPSLQHPDFPKVGACATCRSFGWTFQVPAVDVAGVYHHPTCPDLRRPVPRKAWVSVEGWTGVYSWPIEILEDERGYHVLARSLPHQPPGTKSESVLWLGAVRLPRTRIVEG